MRLLLPIFAGLLFAPIILADECPDFQDVLGTMDDELPGEYYSIDVKEIDVGLYMVEVDFQLRPKESQLRTIAVRIGAAMTRCLEKCSAHAYSGRAANTSSRIATRLLMHGRPLERSLRSSMVPSASR